ncbi:MAG TPA: sugar ABC transporter ATP-binding protein [Candidatus Eisenbacteria bacterium]|nr:sugar ABC transporter ATP-binding protein [Candidatus Eisenbacteria bacterium]
MNSNLLVELTKVNKSFFGVQALKDVSFDLKAGEVHALVGENGAGKSTLMKILTGIYHKDSGEINIKGEEQSIENVRDSMDLGISLIHQELNLVNHLTVAQNIFIGHETKYSSPFFQNDKTINKKARELCEAIGIDVEPDVLVSTLSVAKQQMVEIAKALSTDSEVIIMDEPTASLTHEEISDLFKIVKNLKKTGKGIIYISHRLEELFEIADRVTVLRDGEKIDTNPITELDEDLIIKKMVGREITIEPPVFDESKFGDVALEVSGLNAGDRVKDVSFSVRYGEIVGFAGLVGAGRSETMRAIFGADHKDSGQIKIDGKVVEINHPSDSVMLNMAYLSEDRKSEGIITTQPIFSNISLPKMSDYLKMKFLLNENKEIINADQMVELLDVRTPSSEQLVQYLSGGNQQKVVIAKWLSSDSKIMIFDEPTRGIDVGAKDQIYDLAKDLANQGNAIIVISSEMQEIIRLCNRIYVMSEGRITGELPSENITQEKIMTMAINRKN